MRLLSTKILSLPFKEKLLHHGFSLVEIPFIEIVPLPYDGIHVEDSFIFTSQNAVRMVFENTHLVQKINGKNIFCVGKKTKALLEEKGQKVIKKAENASELADFLTKTHKNMSFSFFCGAQRLPLLESRLKAAHISVTPHEVYKTVACPQAVKTDYEGILFFSPSAVSSFFSANEMLSTAHGFCIGNTTGQALASYTKHYSVAKKSEEAYVLLSLRNHFMTPL